MELKDLGAYGEPGAIVYLAGCVEFMRLVPPESVDAVFADPPYRLSTGGVTVKSGRLAPVDKGSWDRSMGIEEVLRCASLVRCVDGHQRSETTIHTWQRFSVWLTEGRADVIFQRGSFDRFGKTLAQEQR